MILDCHFQGDFTSYSIKNLSILDCFTWYYEAIEITF